MHNKLFIADGAIAVMGGRNIADEYFARGVISNFVDMDVLLVGDIVDRLVGIFDIYWNSPQAYSLRRSLASPTTVMMRAVISIIWWTMVTRCTPLRCRRWICLLSVRWA